MENDKKTSKCDKREVAKTAVKCMVFLGIAVLILLLFFKGCYQRYWTSSHWDIDVDVEYVYENDTIPHHFKTKDQIGFNNTVETVSVEYSSFVGAHSELVLFRTVYAKPYGRVYSKKTEYFKSPDKKFRVTDIKWKVGERTPD